MLSARRVELALTATSAALAAALWQLSIPEIFPHPGLPPERTVQLFSALIATAAATVVRPVNPILESTASVSTSLRRAGLATTATAGVAVVSIASALLMEEEAGTQHVRNVTLYFGTILVLRALAPTAAWFAPWVWLSACLIAGHRLRGPGQGSELRAWAYPLTPATDAPGVALIALGLGLLVSSLSGGSIVRRRRRHAAACRPASP